jgi:hypothetical protein
MSGAFTGLDKIIKKRIAQKAIGFGATLSAADAEVELLGKVKSEDLIEFGFETEFVGRLPVRAFFERLTEADLLAILNNPNNPIILGKKLDFGAYGIEVRFHRDALKSIAGKAFDENTGARGLVSAVEAALLLFERKLPSTQLSRLAVTPELLDAPGKWVDRLASAPDDPANQKAFEDLAEYEIRTVAEYIRANKKNLSNKFGLPLTPARVELAAAFYSRRIINVEGAIERIAFRYEQIKTIEINFLKNHGINIVLEDDTIDHIIGQWLEHPVDGDAIYRQLSDDFLHGLKLVHEKTGRNRFFITRQALDSPDKFIGQLLQKGTTDF